MKKNNIIELRPNNQIFIAVLILIVICIYPLNLKSQDFSTINEIYDYGIGDIFHTYSESNNFTGDGFQDLTNILIIGKYYSLQSDTVFYIRDIQNRRRELNNGELGSWVYTYYIDTIFYSELNSLIISCPLCSTYTDSSYCNGRLVNYSQEELVNASLTKKYVVGCGMTEYNRDGSFSGQLDSTLIYYKKEDEEWGESTLVSTNENKALDDFINIYPNPASNILFLNYNINLSGKLSIYSQFGTPINEIYIDSEIKSIDISGLTPNLYLLVFDLNDRKIIKKLIKK